MEHLLMHCFRVDLPKKKRTSTLSCIFGYVWLNVAVNILVLLLLALFLCLVFLTVSFKSSITQQCDKYCQGYLFHISIWLNRLLVLGNCEFCSSWKFVHDCFEVRGGGYGSRKLWCYQKQYIWSSVACGRILKSSVVINLEMVAVQIA